MFCYKESKLESDLDNLKSEIKKTDYEKTIEPYQKRIKELEKKYIFSLKIWKTYIQLVKNLLKV